MIGFSGMGFYIPDELVPVDKLPVYSELSTDQKERLVNLGIRTISVADEYSSLDMAYMASLMAIQEANLKPEDIGLFLWLPSRAPDYLMRSEVTEMQYRLGLNGAIGFTVGGLGCCDINGAIETAIAFLKAHDRIQHVLIAYGSKPFNYKRYREEITLVGDGGMGIVVSKGVLKQRILSQSMNIDGKYADLFQIAYKDRVAEEYVEECTTNRYKFELSAKSRMIFMKMNQELKDTYRIDLTPHYIMQNLSIPAFNFNEEALGIALMPGCYDNCTKYGHLGSIDILYNYYTEYKNDTMQPNDFVILMNNSPVSCWSSLLLQV